MLKYGIGINSYKTFEIIRKKKLDFLTIFKIDGSILSQFQRNKFNNIELQIKNLMPLSLCSLIIKEPFNLRYDFLEAFAKQVDLANTIGIKKVNLSFDLNNIIFNNNLKDNFLELLSAIYGFLYPYDMQLELNLRVPEIDNLGDLSLLVKYFNQSLIKYKFAIDLFLHEGAFAQIDLQQLLSPIKRSISSIHIAYQIGFGNKINSLNTKNMINYINEYNQNLEVIFLPIGERVNELIEFEITDWEKLVCVN